MNLIERNKIEVQCELKQLHCKYIFTLNAMYPNIYLSIYYIKMDYDKLISNYNSIFENYRIIIMKFTGQQCGMFALEPFK